MIYKINKLLFTYKIKKYILHLRKYHLTDLLISFAFAFIVILFDILK